MFSLLMVLVGRMKMKSELLYYLNYVYAFEWNVKTIISNEVNQFKITQERNLRCTKNCFSITCIQFTNHLIMYCECTLWTGREAYNQVKSISFQFSLS